MSFKASNPYFELECATRTFEFVQGFLNSSSAVSDPAQNFVACPIGLLLLLTTLLGPGAPRGESANQIARALRIYRPDDILTDSRKATLLYGNINKTLTVEMTKLEGKSFPVVRLYNGIFVQKDLQLNSEFLTKIKGDFQSSVVEVNFSDDGSKTVRKINNWTNKQSGGLIKRIFSDPSALDPDTKLLMVNIFTYKDSWDVTFFQTKRETFFLSETENLTVDMMSVEEYMPYVNLPDLGVSIVRKPMRNRRFSFVIVLPNTKWDLAGANEVLSGTYSIRELFGEQKSKELIDLRLPKLKLRTMNDLKPVAQLMGINDIFDYGSANLTGITADASLVVGQLMQGTVLNVDEYGVEAAAVTFAAIVPMMSRDPVKFHVDHPFVCMIYDEQLDIALVAARVLRVA